MPQVPNCYCQTEKCKMCVWSLVFLETSAAFSKYIQLLGVTWMMLRHGEEKEGGLLRQKADTWVQLGERACAAWSCSLAGKGWVKVLVAHGTARSFWSMNTECRASLLCYVNGFGSASVPDPGTCVLYRCWPVTTRRQIVIFMPTWRALALQNVKPGYATLSPKPDPKEVQLYLVRAQPAHICFTFRSSCGALPWEHYNLYFQHSHSAVTNNAVKSGRRKIEAAQNKSNNVLAHTAAVLHLVYYAQLFFRRSSHPVKKMFWRFQRGKLHGCWCKMTAVKWLWLAPPPDRVWRLCLQAAGLFARGCAQCGVQEIWWWKSIFSCIRK